MQSKHYCVEKMRCIISSIILIFYINKFPLCSADYDYITYGAYDTDFERVIYDNDAVKVIPVPQVSYQEEEIKVPVVSYDTEAFVVPAETQGIKIFSDKLFDNEDNSPCDDFDIIQPVKSLKTSQASYKIEQITSVNGLYLTNPKWSSEENALYWTDKYEQIIYRYSPEEDDLSSRKIYYGYTGIAMPVENAPGIILVAVRNELFLLKWGAPGDDLALRQVAVVDIGYPDNIISSGKVDANGRVWFGTQGKNLGKMLFVTDTATLYSMSYENIKNPDVIVRPLTGIPGIAFSFNSKKIFFSDGPAYKIMKYDFILETGKIGNGSVLLDFKDKNLPGLPDGITLDVDGNIWVSTFSGARILKIDPNTGEVIDEIVLPVDQVNSLTWGGKDLRTLYVGTGRRYVDDPKPGSGSLFAITGTGTRGFMDYSFKFPDAETY